MKNRFGFTLIEIIIAVVVLSILSAIGAISWDAMVDKTRQDICEQNQTILVGAIKFYIYDKQAAPTSLSSIYPKYTDFALAKIKKDHPVVYAKRAISLAILRASEPKSAWAVGEISPYLGMRTSVLHCPEDSNGGISYGLHDVFDTNVISGIPAKDIYDYCANTNQIIIGDCNNDFFSDPSEFTGRHGNTILGNNNIAVFCSASGNSEKLMAGGNVPSRFGNLEADYIIMQGELGSQ